MSRVFYLPTFLKQLQKLKGREAHKAEEALVAFDHFVQSGEKTEGLGFKKLSHDKFEIHVDLRKQIVMKKMGDGYYLALYGDHDEVERFLRRQ